MFKIAQGDNVKVELLSHTPEPEKLAAAAARVCYSSQGARDIMATIKEEKVKKRIADCVAKGHHSILEHVNFTFSVEGISRVTSHQLVRHRIASYSQQSQRCQNSGNKGEGSYAYKRIAGSSLWQHVQW